MTKMTRKQNESCAQFLASHWMRGLFVVGVLGVLIFMLVESPTANTTPDPSDSMAAETTGDLWEAKNVVIKAGGGTPAGHLISGTVATVAYYHCAAHTHPPVRDVILLHGAKFTKEDWKRSTILSRLCANGKLSVTALDLSVAADGKQLKKMLQALAVGEGMINPEGNYVVVTPSASGKSVVDWINNGDLEELQEKIGLWVPIASPSISAAQVEKLHTLRDDKWPILALYGDEDKRGEELSAKLAAEAKAFVKEFPGPHPFYLDIPEEFSNYLLKRLQVA